MCVVRCVVRCVHACVRACLDVCLDVCVDVCTCRSPTCTLIVLLHHPLQVSPAMPHSVPEEPDSLGCSAVWAGSGHHTSEGCQRLLDDVLQGPVRVH